MGVRGVRVVREVKGVRVVREVEGFRGVTGESVESVVLNNLFSRSGSQGG